MKKNISLIVGIFAAIAIATLLLDVRVKPRVRTIDDIAEKSSIKVRIAPDFSATDIRGRKVRLSDFKGKIVILHFWATWCPPCVGEFPKLTAMANSFRDDVVVLALSSDSQEKTIRQFITQSAPASAKLASFYSVWDENRAVTHDLYQTFSYPETIIIDRNAAMVRKIPGDADWTSQEMTSYLEDIAGTIAKPPLNP
ncbi:MAG: hypothetical protein DI586_07515 [Micavibrio aeruginosavorus]|uniref:Thioredoxin domain-containing protein n=1 Tax=Micavibrio aeruginosavorus TaxID=349221 RepID=A0A2W5HAY2_9BACT|nr:MAG: hypothetical protein DI586_07515 [Micavibrio aeruginosavorus]